MLKQLFLGLIFVLTVSTANAQYTIQIDEIYEPHMPIVAKVENSVPNNSEEVSVIFLWDTNENAGLNYLEVGDGSEIHIWAKPGRHRLKLQVFEIDWTTREFKKSFASISFQVIGGPDPGPNPTPNPEPKPDFSDVFAEKIYNIGFKVSPEWLDKLLEVGDNYAAVAAQAAATKGWTPSRMLSAVKMKNLVTLNQDGSDALRETFFRPLAMELSSVLGGDSADLKKHIKYWNLVSEGLSKLDANTKKIRLSGSSGPVE